MVNGAITPSSSKPADIADTVTDNGLKPSAERCRLSETGDQLHNDVIESPLSATSPVSENGEDCCESVGRNEDCSGVGTFDVRVVYFVHKICITYH